MVFPTLSVTVIGLVAGLLALRFSREPRWRTFAHGLVGAWAGFLAGAVIGVTIDVVLQSGELVALLGHMGAVLFAYLAVTRLPGWPSSSRARTAHDGRG